MHCVLILFMEGSVGQKCAPPTTSVDMKKLAKAVRMSESEMCLACFFSKLSFLICHSRQSNV